MYNKLYKMDCGLSIYKATQHRHSHGLAVACAFCFGVVWCWTLICEVRKLCSPVVADVGRARIINFNIDGLVKSRQNAIFARCQQIISDGYEVENW